MAFSLRRQESVMKPFVPASIVFVAAVLLSGCSASRPVLYPNDHYKAVGPDQAEMDIADCQRLAQQYGATGGGKAGDVAGSTTTGAAVGAAAGAAGGAVRGRPGRGAAVGAATGGTVGFMRGIFRTTSPDAVEKRFIERCLRERGYDPLAWK